MLISFHVCLLPFILMLKIFHKIAFHKSYFLIFTKFSGPWPEIESSSGRAKKYAWPTGPRAIGLARKAQVFGLFGFRAQPDPTLHTNDSKNLTVLFPRLAKIVHNLTAILWQILKLTTNLNKNVTLTQSVKKTMMTLRACGDKLVQITREKMKKGHVE